MKSMMIQGSTTKNDDVFIQTIPNGNVEIVTSRNKSSIGKYIDGHLTCENPGGMIDSQVCIIPKNEITKLIEFLKGLA